VAGFWDRRLAEIKGPGYTQPPPSRQGPPGYSPPPEQPGYVRRQLAVRRPGHGETDLAQHIQREGYIRKPPEWVQRQPHDTCPNCGSPDLAAVSSGGYSRPGAPGAILRCFDCNWSSSRGVSALWGVPSSGPVTGAAVQSRDGHVSLRNTGLITS
jgi:hypothetical protein